jgi:hypothetical protein
MSASQDGEPSREALVEELRAVGLLALDRLDPLISLATAVLSAPADARACTACPLCAALADAGPGRADALAEAARHATGLLAALRVALAADGPAEPAAEPQARPERVVQHIPVERTPTC